MFPLLTPSAHSASGPRWGEIRHCLNVHLIGGTPIVWHWPTRSYRRKLSGRRRVAMQITGMLHGARLLDYVEFPAAEVLGPDATEDDIQGLIDRHKLIFIKPLFRGGVGKKGKSGLIGKALDLKSDVKEKERLYFVEHHHAIAIPKANGATFER